MNARAKMVVRNAYEKSTLSSTEMFVVLMSYESVDFAFQEFENAGHYPTRIHLSPRAWRTLTLDSSYYDPEMTSPDEKGFLGKLWGVSIRLVRDLPSGTAELEEVGEEGVTYRVVLKLLPQESESPKDYTDSELGRS